MNNDEIVLIGTKWGLNYVEMRFLLTIIKTTESSDPNLISELFWCYNGDLYGYAPTKEFVRRADPLFLSDLLGYILENTKINEWRCNALFSFFKRRFREVDVALEEGKKEFSQLRTSSEPSCKIEFTD